MTPQPPSPTPWTADSGSIRAADGRWIASVDRIGVDCETNAALIVQAVNAYEPMLEALKLAFELVGAPPSERRNYILHEIGEAIRLAEGREETPHA